MGDGYPQAIKYFTRPFAESDARNKIELKSHSVFAENNNNKKRRIVPVLR